MMEHQRWRHNLISFLGYMVMVFIVYECVVGKWKWWYFIIKSMCCLPYVCFWLACVFFVHKSVCRIACCFPLPLNPIKTQTLFNGLSEKQNMVLVVSISIFFLGFSNIRPMRGGRPCIIRGELKKISQ